MSFALFGFFYLFILFYIIFIFNFLYLKKLKILFIYIFLIFYFIFYLIKIFYCFKNIYFNNDFLILNLGCWLSIDILKINWEFILDSFNIFLMIIIFIISSLVQLYSIHYMESDKNLIKFLSYLSLFSFFMIFLIMSNNFLILFVGWEGVGLISYLLINFWSTRVQANKSALKAMIFNRVGDFSLLISILFIFNNFYTFNFHTIFLLNILFNEIYNDFILFNLFNINFFDFICFFLLIACMAKSAQLGLHLWLPDAMEGPTPVSALLHAATMVTAGIFLIIRCSFLFEFSSNMLSLVCLIGSLTSLISGLIGLFQYDIKKIVAYSTCSQLGFMFVACGLSSYSFALYHLINHSFFKALLFLSCGSIIHSLGEEQDIRKMGSLYKILPFTFISFLLSSFSLIGFFFFSGFFSKELILISSFLKTNFIFNFFYFFLLYISGIITSLYSIKIIYYLFFLENQVSSFYLFSKIRESSFIFIIIFSILIFFSLVSGFFLKDFFLISSDFFSNSIFILPFNNILNYIEFIPLFLKYLLVLSPFFGFILFYVLYKFRFYFFIDEIFFINKKFFFDKIYFYFIFFFIFRVKKLVFDIDKGFIEMVINLLNICVFFFYKLFLYFFYKNYFIYNLFFYIFFFILLILLFILLKLNFFNFFILFLYYIFILFSFK